VQLGPSANVCFEREMLGHMGKEVRGIWRDWQDEELFRVIEYLLEGLLNQWH